MSLKRKLKRAKELELAQLSTLERWSLRMLEHVQAKLPHPLVGIVIGFLIAFAGRSELALRSWGLLLIVAWLAVDLWAWLLPKQVSYGLKYVIGCTATSAMLILMMGVMWWWLDGKLHDERLDTLAKMTVSMAAPGNDDPLSSIVTITNPSLHDVSVRRAACWMNHITYANHMHFERSASSLPLALANPLIKGGDAESDQCEWSSVIKLSAPPECVDMTVDIVYSLTDQPSIIERRSFRFVTRKESFGFRWYQQSLGVQKVQCPID